MLTAPIKTPMKQINLLKMGNGEWGMGNGKWNSSIEQKSGEKAFS